MRVPEAGWTLLWALLGAAACAALAPLAPDLAGEGLLLHVGERLASGERLYLDVDVAGGPLSYEILGLLFALVGADVAIARALLVACTGLGAACAFRLARAARARSFAHAAAALVVAAPALTFPEGFRLTAPWLALHLGLAAVLAAVLGLRSHLAAALAGLLEAAVLLTLPVLGLGLGVGLTALFARLAPPEQRAPRLALLLGGILLGVGGLLGPYALSGQLEAMATSLPATFGPLGPPAWRQALSTAHAERALPGLLATFGGQDAAPGEPLGLARLLLTVPALALLAVLARRVLRGPQAPALWGVTVLVAAWAVALGRLPSWSELAPALVPSLLLALLIASATRAVVESPNRRAAASALSAFTLGAACAVTVGLHRAAEPESLSARVPLRPVNAADVLEAAQVVREVRARVREGEPMLVLGNAPLLYFATATRNPTRFPGVIPSLGEEAESALLSELDAVDTIVSFEAGRLERSRLQRHLERHFRVAEAFRSPPTPTMIVLERGTDRGAVALDLVELSGQARRFIVDEHDAERPARRQPPTLPVSLHRRPLPFVLGLGGGGLDFDLELPPSARFEAEIGLAPLRGERLHGQPRGALTLWLERGEGFVQLARFELSEQEPLDWIPVAVDLARFGGSRATLRLGFEPRPGARPSSLAWWGSPRVVSHPAQLR